MNIKFETVKTSYRSMLRLQASSHAPVPFYDGPVFLQDSRGICRYIAETYEHSGCPFLLGNDALGRASVEQWLRNEEHAFNPPSRALFCHLAFPLDEEGDDDNDIDMQRRRLEEVLEVYEQRLGDRKYLAGDEFTLADLAHLPNCHHIAESGRFRYLLESRRNVWRWWSTISSRDSWQQVVRDMKTVEHEHKLASLEELRWGRKRRGAVVRQVRKDPRKHIIAKSETV
ncbi:hypothetical protein SETIT_3G386000v2 [Setaria italica]|uniref:glutathione transferase n=1 Tax=Setaria italica TaxID=4555 RepID=A0A368QNR1_SETIT|nr:hypothetical protein SETIT_3G386000v2 [Setaria italica]